MHAQTKIQVDWIKCDGGSWCQLNALNLDNNHFDGMEGVYLIWYGGQNPKAIYVGQGSIRRRLADHRQSQQIQKYKEFGTLFVTWAEVSGDCRDGVEAFLAQRYKPLAGNQFPDVVPIEVNLPE